MPRDSHVGQGEVRKIRRERDQLKEATSQMESELIQVCGCVCGCVSVGGCGYGCVGGALRNGENRGREQRVNSFFTCTFQIQSDAKSLANDRDNFKLLYEQVSH